MENDPSQPVQPSTPLTLEEIERQAKAMSAGTADIPEETPIKEQVLLVHTYEDDMSRAMNVSDAKVVQKLMSDAREKESLEALREHNTRAKGWYVAGSIILLIVALASIGYGAYYYTRLTVPVSSSVSVGVFPSTEPIPADTTTIESVIERFATTDTMSAGKPYLVEIVNNSNDQTLLTNSALFSFLGATPTEPFATSLSSVRFGIMNTPNKTVPFIIASVTTPDIAIKEFLIAEPTLLQMFKRALAIAPENISTETAPAFIGEYRNNVPVRALYTTDSIGAKSLTLLYASITDNIIVITTEPSVLSAIYDTVLRQQ